MLTPAALHDISSFSDSTKTPAIVVSEGSGIEATQYLCSRKLSLDTILKTVMPSIMTPKLKQLSPTFHNTILNVSRQSCSHATDAMSAEPPLKSLGTVRKTSTVLPMITTALIGPKTILKTRFATRGQAQRKKAVMFNDQVQIIDDIVPTLDVDGLSVPATYATAIIPSPRYPTQPSGTNSSFGLLNRALHPLRIAQLLKVAAKNDVGNGVSASATPLPFINSPTWAMQSSSPLLVSRCGSALNMASPNIFLTSPSVFA